MNHFNDTCAQAWIPHRGGMCLIDQVIAVDAEHAVAELEVPADGLFVRHGGVPGWVGIEYMAQTIAAWSGARARRAGGAPRIGLLLGSRRYEVQRAWFPSGAKLRVEARCELMADNGMGQFDCRIVMEGQPVAAARVSVFEPPEGVSLSWMAGRP